MRRQGGTQRRGRRITRNYPNPYGRATNIDAQGEGARITAASPGLPSGPAEKHAPTKLRGLRNAPGYGTAEPSVRGESTIWTPPRSMAARDRQRKGTQVAGTPGGMPSPPTRQGSPSGMAPFLRRPRNTSTETRPKRETGPPTCEERLWPRSTEAATKNRACGRSRGVYQTPPTA